jgi:pantoate--beta-alanine ligase
MHQACSVVSSLAEMHALSKQWAGDKITVGLVCSMGCLHEGHLSLIREARQKNQKVVVSIFVNPLQFGPNEDLERYPKPFLKDFELCQAAGVDVIFHPRTQDIYPPQFQTRLFGGEAAKKYCGRSRPGHFDGVLTIVHLLFNLVRPTLAYFGEKDFQQLFLIKQMCRDLWLPTQIVPMPTIREKSGLALSSRNTYLSETQKERATCLFHAITKVQQAAQSGHCKTAELLSLAAFVIRQTPEMHIDYVHLVDLKTLMPLGDELNAPARLLLAAFIGENPRVRLIDNGLVTPSF